jgi:hypothetical protein
LPYTTLVRSWTIGWFTFLTRPKTRDGKVLSMQGAVPGKFVSAGPPPKPGPTST